MNKVKIWQTDGKLFVEGKRHGFVQGMIRTLYLSVSEIQVRNNLDRTDGGVHQLSYWLSGKAQLDTDRLCIMGNDELRTKELKLSIRPWLKLEADQAAALLRSWIVLERLENEPEEKQPKYGEGRGTLGYIAYDPEIGGPATWYLDIHMPKAVVDEIAVAYRQDRLETVSLGLRFNLWVEELDWHAPPSAPVTWYLALPPDGRSDFPRRSWGEVTLLNWSERLASLSVPEKN